MGHWRYRDIQACGLYFSHSNDAKLYIYISSREITLFYAVNCTDCDVFKYKCLSNVKKPFVLIQTEIKAWSRILY
jgi:hypothetical protein